LVSGDLSDDDSLKRDIFKRALDDVPDDVNEFIVDQFDDDDLINVVPDGQDTGTTSAFKKFGKTAFNMGTQGLCGCSVLAVVSQEAAWMAHFLYAHPPTTR
jgi:hypothetical protein